jgi:hypothetical protein
VQYESVSKPQGGYQGADGRSRVLLKNFDELFHHGIYVLNYDFSPVALPLAVTTSQVPKRRPLLRGVCRYRYT